MSSAVRTKYSISVRIIAAVILGVIALAQFNATVWHRSLLGIEARTISNISYLLGLFVFLYLVRLTAVARGSGTDE